jgi:hypothetical protein
LELSIPFSTFSCLNEGEHEREQSHGRNQSTGEGHGEEKGIHRKASE